LVLLLESCEILLSSPSLVDSLRPSQLARLLDALSLHFLDFPSNPRTSRADDAASRRAMLLEDGQVGALALGVIERVVVAYCGVEDRWCSSMSAFWMARGMARIGVHSARLQEKIARLVRKRLRGDDPLVPRIVAFAMHTAPSDRELVDADFLESLLNEGTSREVSGILYIYARRGLGREEVYLVGIQRLLQLGLHQLSTKELSLTLWSLTRSTVSPANPTIRMFLAGARHHVIGRMSMGPASDLTLSLWALCKLNSLPPDDLTLALGAVLQRPDALTLFHLTQMLTAITHLHTHTQGPDDDDTGGEIAALTAGVWAMVGEKLAKGLEEAGVASDVSTLIWVAASSDYRNETVLAMLRAAFIRQIDDTSPREMALAVWGLERLGLADLEVCSAVQQSLADEESVEMFPAGSVALLFSSLLLIRSCPSSLLSMLARQTRKHLMEFDEKDLAQLAWSMAEHAQRSGGGGSWRDPLLLTTFAEALVPSLPAASDHDHPDASAEAAKRLESFTSRGLCLLMSAFPRAGVGVPLPLMLAARRLLIQKAHTWPWRDVSLMVWSVAKMGRANREVCEAVGQAAMQHGLGTLHDVQLGHLALALGVAARKDKSPPNGDQWQHGASLLTAIADEMLLRLDRADAPASIALRIPSSPNTSTLAHYYISNGTHDEGRSDTIRLENVAVLLWAMAQQGVRHERFLRVAADATKALLKEGLDAARAADGEGQRGEGEEDNAVRDEGRGGGPTLLLPPRDVNRLIQGFDALDYRDEDLYRVLGDSLVCLFHMFPMKLLRSSIATLKRRVGDQPDSDHQPGADTEVLGRAQRAGEEGLADR